MSVSQFEKTIFLLENEEYLIAFEETDTDFRIRPRNSLISPDGPQKWWGPDPLTVIYLTDLLAPFGGKWNCQLQMFVVPKATPTITALSLEKTAAADSQIENLGSEVEASIVKLREYFSKQLSQQEIKRHLEILNQHGVSPSEISNKTGASRATIYRLFPKELKDSCVSNENPVGAQKA